MNLAHDDPGTPPVNRRSFARALPAVAVLTMMLSGPAVGAGLGDAAPDFRLEDLAGRTHRLTGMRGEVVILAYWATWCASCKSELAALDRAYRAYRSRGLDVIAVTMDRGIGTDRLRRWTGDMMLPVATAANHGDEAYGPIGGTLPTTYIISRAGRLAFRRAGAITAGELERILSALLDERSPGDASRDQ